MVELTFSSKECVSFLYARNHGKGHPKPGDVPPSSVLGTLMDGLSGCLSPQPLQTSGTLTGTTSVTVSLPSFSLKDTSPNGYLSGTGWGR